MLQQTIKIQHLFWLYSLPKEVMTQKLMFEKQKLSKWYKQQYIKNNKDDEFFCQVAEALL